MAALSDERRLLIHGGDAKLGKRLVQWANPLNANAQLLQLECINYFLPPLITLKTVL